MGEKLVADTRSVTAVEGTKATLTFRLNKPVVGATLVPTPRAKPATQEATEPAAPEPLALKVDPNDPSAYAVTLDMKQSQTFRLHLTDDHGRTNKQPPELALNVLPNRPPELKLLTPGHDVDAS